LRKTFAPKCKQLLVVFSILAISCVAVVAAPIPPDKMKPEELVAKHVASIGPADALTAVKSRVALGKVKFVSHSSALRDIAGVAQIASEGDKVVLAMLFDLLDYPFEKVGYDGEKTTVALLPSTGNRTALGAFLMSQTLILKEGLFGGTLSSAWPLLNLASNNPRLSYAGTKKIDNREVHELKYAPRKGGANMQISLYFDATTFQHVRTEYQYSVSAQMSSRPSSEPIPTAAGTQQISSHYKLVEEFGDFRPEGKLTLPHTYNIRLMIDVPGSTSSLEYIINFSQFAFDQPIGIEAFNVGKTK
jgi:hypothetical protein